MTIVVGYAPDQLGRAAVEAGLAVAAARGSDLVVVDATRESDGGADPSAAQERERLDELLGASDVPSTVRQSGGADAVIDVADVVLEVAEEVDASLVVIGLRRRTPVGKMLMGSVAQRILLEASVPVLAVKPDQGGAAALGPV